MERERQIKTERERASEPDTEKKKRQERHVFSPFPASSALGGSRQTESCCNSCHAVGFV